MRRTAHFETSAPGRFGGTLRAGAVPWFATGGLWTAMMLVYASGGTPAEKSAWGMMLLLSGLWLAAVCVDWVQRLGTISSGAAEVLRAGILGGAMLASPVAVANPEALLPYWITGVVTAAAATFCAPLVVEARHRQAARKLLDDAKTAVAAAGLTLFLVVVLTAGLGPLGAELSADAFVASVATAAFCILPTVFTRLRNASPLSAHASG